MKNQAKLSVHGPARRKRRSPQQVAAQIIAAAEAEFERCGYAGATTAAIARRAKTTEAQIFRHFESKQALFRAAIFSPLNRHFSDFLSRNIAEQARATPQREKARRYVEELQDFMAQHAGMVQSLIVASAYGAPISDRVGDMEGLQAYFERGAATMQARLGKRARVDPKLMVRVSFAAVLACAAFKDWLFPPGLASDKAIRGAITAFVLNGVAASG